MQSTGTQETSQDKRTRANKRKAADSFTGAPLKQGKKEPVEMKGSDLPVRFDTAVLPEAMSLKQARVLAVSTIFSEERDRKKPHATIHLGHDGVVVPMEDSWLKSPLPKCGSSVDVSSMYVDLNSPYWLHLTENGKISNCLNAGSFERNEQSQKHLKTTQEAKSLPAGSWVSLQLRVTVARMCAGNQNPHAEVAGVDTNGIPSGAIKLWKFKAPGCQPGDQIVIHSLMMKMRLAGILSSKFALRRTAVSLSFHALMAEQPLR